MVCHVAVLTVVKTGPAWPECVCVAASKPNTTLTSKRHDMVRFTQSPRSPRSPRSQELRSSALGRCCRSNTTVWPSHRRLMIFSFLSALCLVSPPPRICETCIGDNHAGSLRCCFPSPRSCYRGLSRQSGGYVCPWLFPSDRLERLARERAVYAIRTHKKVIAPFRPLPPSSPSFTKSLSTLSVSLLASFPIVRIHTHPTPANSHWGQELNERDARREMFDLGAVVREVDRSRRTTRCIRRTTRCKRHTTHDTRSVSFDATNRSKPLLNESWRVMYRRSSTKRARGARAARRAARRGLDRQRISRRKG
jgi:hypothetical protein